MDLGLFARVVWRFKIVFAVGLVLAVALAVLSTAKVSFSGGAPTLTYRGSEQWQSQTSLFITQEGFPWGRVATSTPSASTYAAASGLANVAPVYARLASGDAVRALLRLKPGESVSGVPMLDQTQRPLPLIGINAVAPSARDATLLSLRAAQVFQKYIDHQQQAAGIPPNQRVVLQMVNGVSQLQLLTPHKKTVPIVIFLGVMIAVLALIFALENLRPRLHAARVSAAEAEHPPLQRTA